MKLFGILLITFFGVINTQNLNPCFGVPDDTFFPHPRTLSKFLACFEGTLKEGSCPPGMQFDRIELFCDLPQNPTTTRQPNNGNNICTGVPNETFFPHPNSERKYITCVSGQKFEIDCPNDHPIFNAQELYCDYEVQVQTRQPPAPTRQPPNRPGTQTVITTVRPLPTRPTRTSVGITRAPPTRRPI